MLVGLRRAGRWLDFREKTVSFAKVDGLQARSNTLAILQSWIIHWEKTHVSFANVGHQGERRESQRAVIHSLFFSPG